MGLAHRGEGHRRVIARPRPPPLEAAQAGRGPISPDLVIRAAAFIREFSSPAACFPSVQRVFVPLWPGLWVTYPLSQV